MHAAVIFPSKIDNKIVKWSLLFQVIYNNFYSFDWNWCMTSSFWFISLTVFGLKKKLLLFNIYRKCVRRQVTLVIINFRHGKITFSSSQKKKFLIKRLNLPSWQRGKFQFSPAGLMKDKVGWYPLNLRAWGSI